jgi:protein disulfide-isomerase A6
MFYLFAIAAVIILLFFVVRSKFTAETKKSSPESAKLDSISDDTVLIFFAPWCGHCKRAMPEFTKASEMPDIKVLMINSDDPKNKSLLQQHSVKGFPHIVKANGTVHEGPRTAEAIAKFAEK